jgi:glutathionyl-hydroquinone reductase
MKSQILINAQQKHSLIDIILNVDFNHINKKMQRNYKEASLRKKIDKSNNSEQDSECWILFKIERERRFFFH